MEMRDKREQKGQDHERFYEPEEGKATGNDGTGLGVLANPEIELAGSECWEWGDEIWG